MDPYVQQRLARAYQPRFLARYDDQEDRKKETDIRQLRKAIYQAHRSSFNFSTLLSSNSYSPSPSLEHEGIVNRVDSVSTIEEENSSGYLEPASTLPPSLSLSFDHQDTKMNNYDQKNNEKRVYGDHVSKERMALFFAAWKDLAEERALVRSYLHHKRKRELRSSFEHWKIRYWMMLEVKRREEEQRTKRLQQLFRTWKERTKGSPINPMSDMEEAAQRLTTIVRCHQLRVAWNTWHQTNTKKRTMLSKAHHLVDSVKKRFLRG